MCGLFGFSQYGERPMKDSVLLTESLAEESAVRGIDATGIAFCKNGSIEILKDSRSAYTMKLTHPDDVKTVMGHTRHTTQGSEKKNFNNHPFGGKTKGSLFALAHNGILANCKQLALKYDLPKTHIETDSYTAVQLLEKKKKIDLDSVKYMAEAVEGSFCFSVLDDKNNLYLVKGDNPLEVLHFPEQKIYVYASTEEILWKALVSSSLFDNLKSGRYEQLIIGEGDIVRISHGGKVEYKKFRISDRIYGSLYRDTAFCDWYGNSDCNYISELKSVAGVMGYSPDLVDEMLGCGFTFDDIEEYIYCG